MRRLPPIHSPLATRHSPTPPIHSLLAIRHSPPPPNKHSWIFASATPACGSGHFLIAAAERLAVHLARLRTGDDQPGTLAVQQAKRQIIGRCIYGVDLNPMAVELCKVSLWMEALEPGKPLSFLDHHIQCGNSLLGTTPALLAGGIPDEAFTAIEGDERAVVTQLKRENKQERKDHERGYRDFHFAYDLGNLPAEFARLSGASDESVADSQAKADHYASLVRGTPYQNARLLADAWCAAFVWKKDSSSLGKLCPTDRTFRNLEASPASLLPHVRAEIERLRDQYQFFHWHLAFPDIFRLPTPNSDPENAHCGWSGGFDAMLGNPPWEVIKVEAADSEDRARRQHIFGVQKFTKKSGRFPLGCRGKANTMPLFTELFLRLVASSGNAGLIVKTVIATERDYRVLFSHLVDNTHLQRLVDIENSLPYFEDVHRQERFSLFTLSGKPTREPAEYAVCLHLVDELLDSARRFRLSASQLRSLGGGACTVPSAQSARELRLLVELAKRDTGRLFGNGWAVKFFKMFDTTEVARATSTVHLTEIGIQSADELCRVYEGKLIDAFDHRCATFQFSGNGPTLEESRTVEKTSAHFFMVPRFSVPRRLVDKKLSNHQWDREWLITYGRKVNRNNVRTISAAVIPRSGAVDTCPTLLLSGTEVGDRAQTLLALMNSYVFDYFVRQKLSGFTIGRGHLNLLTIPKLDAATAPIGLWPVSFNVFVRPRALELTYTAWDLEPFARDCGYEGPPFRWDEERRFWMRCELDAAYFHLYGIARDDVDYILETFPIVKRKDIARHGDYRTKLTILRLYDALAEATSTGRPYQTPLNPPPGPPSDAAGQFVPVSQWDPGNWPPHVHRPR
jgi:hypothetical protein